MDDRNAPLALALAAKRAHLLAAAQQVVEIPEAGGVLALTPALPRVYELNLLLAPAPADPDAARALLSACDAAQAAAGVAHRRLRVTGTMAPGLLDVAARGSGWTVDRELVMAQRPAGDGPAPPGVLVERPDPVAFRHAEDVAMRAERHGDQAEVRRQLLGQRGRWDAAAPVRTPTLIHDGKIAAWCRLYDHATIAEVDDVTVMPALRGRGHGRALLQGVLATLAGSAVFLCAAADDWPRELYAQLGFATVGERVGALLEDP